MLLKCQAVSDQAVAGALCSIMLLEESSPRQALTDFLMARKAVIQTLLNQPNHGGCDFFPKFWSLSIELNRVSRERLEHPKGYVFNFSNRNCLKRVISSHRFWHQGPVLLISGIAGHHVKPSTCPFLHFTRRAAARSMPAMWAALLYSGDHHRPASHR